MTSLVAVVEDDEVYVQFEEGDLLVMSSAEEQVHGKSALTYGVYRDEISGLRVRPYILPLTSLRKLVGSSPLDFIPLDDHTEARRTLRGDLVIRRMLDPSTEARFSKAEYRTIMRYVEELPTNP